MVRISSLLSLFVLVAVVASGCQPIKPRAEGGPAPVALKPGDKVGEMVVAKGPVPFDLNIPPYPAFCNPNPMLDLGSTVAKPGEYAVECSVPPLPKMVIAFGLTARTAELLDEVWAVTSSELHVNDKPIDQSAFGSLDADVPVTGMPGQDPSEVLNLKLRVWNVILENLTPGQFTMRVVWRMSQDAFDGDITWPAGDYVVNHKITVDESMAMSEGEPAPVEMARRPVEYVRKIDTSAQQIKIPVSLAVDGQGNVYITDGSETPRVLKYDNQGNFVLAWGSRGSGEGQFEFIPPTPDAGPIAGFVATDAQGNVYVTDSYNGRVQKFDPNGKFLMQFGEMGSADGQFDYPGPGPIYVDNQGNIYVSTFPRVQKFDRAGNFLAAYGAEGGGDGQFTGAALGTIDDAGNMYVADLLNARVQKLDPSGAFLLKWGNAGTEAGQFYLPVAIVQDSAGKLYVADNTGRIQIFDVEGNHLGQWSETGDGNPALSGEISGLAIDAQDNIYVADAATPSIYVFRPHDQASAAVQTSPQGLRPDAPPYAVHGPFAVGYKPLVIGEGTAHPLDASIWYPALNPMGVEESVTYKAKVKDPEQPPDSSMDIYGHALLNAEIDASQGPYPLVILSHGLTDNAATYGPLVEHLASYGFIVLAPEHVEQFDSTMDVLWKSLIDRPRDLKQTLDYAEQLTAPGGDMAGLIDMQNVAVVGHSSGGYTALAMGGAEFDLAAFNAGCAQLSEDDPHSGHCSSLVPNEAKLAAYAGFDPMPEGLWPSFGDPRVKAIIPLAGNSYLFDKAGLSKITIPMLAMGGTADTGTTYEWGAKLAYDNASSAQKALVTFTGADHMIFRTPCENQPAITPEHPVYIWFCFDPVWDKARALDLVNHFSTAFLLDTLKGDEAAHAALLQAAVNFPGIEYTTIMK